MTSLKQYYCDLMTMEAKKHKAFLVVLAVLCLVTMPSLSFAGDVGSGTHDNDFGEIWDVLVGWTQGVLGRIVALTMILVGIVMGVARQSIMAFVMGPAAGMGLFYASDIINSIMGAGLIM